MIKINAAYQETISNDRYALTFTGASIYVMDARREVLYARFRDLKYVYRGAFNPARNGFVAKSNEPFLAFYSLDDMALLRKIRLKRNNQPQDHGFCFSPDGRLLYNIEYTPKLLCNIVAYDCDAYEETDRLFAEDRYCFDCIRFDERAGMYRVTGFERLDSEGNNACFRAAFDGKTLFDRTPISEAAYREDWYAIWRKQGLID